MELIRDPQTCATYKRPRAVQKNAQQDWFKLLMGKPAPIEKRYREFTSAHLTPGTSDYKQFELGTTKDNRLELAALALLRSVSSRPPGDAIAEQAMIDATMALIPDYPGDAKAFYEGKDLREIAVRTYHDLLNEELKMVRLWLPPGRFTPVVRCPDIKTAAFVYHAYRGVSACLNCRKQFATDFRRADGSKGELYCSVRCGQQYRQKVYRSKVKAILEANRRAK
jgi:hypothetical protein